MSRNTKVLIVDDEVDLVDMLKIHLEAAGYDVVTAQNGRQGLEVARKSEPDIIMLDIMMPNLDGYQTCKLIKRDKSLMKKPIIMLTAKGQAADEIQGYDCGADAYIVKPFDCGALIEKIERLLQEADGGHLIPVERRGKSQ